MRETLSVIYVTPKPCKRKIASSYVTGRKLGNTLTARDRQNVAQLTFRQSKSGVSLPALARPHGAKQERHLADASDINAISRRDHKARAYARYLDRLDRGLPMA